jgi:hypothetical protein
MTYHHLGKEHDDPIWPRYEIARLISDIVCECADHDLVALDVVGETVIKELGRHP